MALPEKTYESIDAIKKAFIELNQLPASNEAKRPNSLELARVQAYLAPKEKLYGISVSLKDSLTEVDLSTVRPAYEGVAAVMRGDKVVVLLDAVHDHAQTLQAYDYGVVGLKALPGFVPKIKGFWMQLSQSMTEPQLELLTKRYGLNLEDKQQHQLALEFYMADSAAVGVVPTFLERREAWQRAMVRKFYPSLDWSSNDLHYLLHRVRKQLAKQAIKKTKKAS